MVWGLKFEEQPVEYVAQILRNPSVEGVGFASAFPGSRAEVPFRVSARWKRTMWFKSQKGIIL